MIVRLLALIAALFVLAPANAADATFPRGVRVGLVPADGLQPAAGFIGFESVERGAKVLMAELPAGAYGEVEAAFKAAADAAAPGPKPQSLDTAAGRAFFTVESARDGANALRRYSVIAQGGPAFSAYVAVQVEEGAKRPLGDDEVRAMLATLTTRAEVPVEEQLSLMPFKLGELGQFKTVRMLAPGAALLIADGDEQSGIEASPFMVLGFVNTAPDNAEDRGRYAQQIAQQVPGLRDARLTVSEPLRITGAPGFETRLDGVMGKDGAPVTVVQWLRFGSGNVAMRIIASAPKDKWAEAFPRFRAVRDGMQPR